MPRVSKTGTLLSLFRSRKSSRGSAASMNAAYENLEDEDTGRRFSPQLHDREELMPVEICSRDNASSGAAEGTASSKDCNAEDEARALHDTLLQFQEFRETQIHLERCLQTLKTSYYQDHSVIMHALEEEISRKDDLTKELADFIELYQNETLSLREELGSTKEMIEYRVQEVTKDFHEALAALQNRVLELEKQPQQMEVQRPQETMLGRVLRFPLVIWSGFLTVVSTPGHFLMSLKPSGPILFAVLSAVILPVILNDRFARCNFFSPH
uniref:Transmembrane and coiled-coil domains protein 1-like n=1 Tax=Fundulus heteroclitus TaxID=8078 RepID=A0A3Q2U1D6_FUNHE